MRTLTIKDLARNEELDRAAMASVRGGYKKYSAYPLSFDFSHDVRVDAQQVIAQDQRVETLVANGSAFLNGTTTSVTTFQDASNNINVF